MSKAIEETKKLIEQIEGELSAMRAELDEVQANHPQRQIDIGLRIDQHKRYLETLKALLQTLGRE